MAAKEAQRIATLPDDELAKACEQAQREARLLHYNELKRKGPPRPVVPKHLKAFVANVPCLAAPVLPCHEVDARFTLAVLDAGRFGHWPRKALAARWL